MKDKETNLEKAIRQASASLWLDGLPLSKEYVENYKNRRIGIQKKEATGPRLVLKRGVKNGRR